MDDSYLMLHQSEVEQETLQLENSPECPPEDLTCLTPLYNLPMTNEYSDLSISHSRSQQYLME